MQNSKDELNGERCSTADGVCDLGARPAESVHIHAPQHAPQRRAEGAGRGGAGQGVGQGRGEGAGRGRAAHVHLLLPREREPGHRKSPFALSAGRFQ